MADHDPSNTPSKGKGKQRSTEDDHDHAPQALPSTTSGSSVLSRIAQSAAALGRDAASARPSGGDLAALAATDKASRASRAPSAAAAEASAGESSASAAAPRWISPASGGDSQAQQHAMAQDAAFSAFLDGADVDMSLPAEPIIGLGDGGAREMTAMDSVWAQQTQIWRGGPAMPQGLQQPQQPQRSAVAEQESMDGLDVVNLLSAGGPAEEEPNYDDIELAEEEMEVLKHALFGNGDSAPATNQDWDHVLNFIPDFVRPDPHGGYEGDDALLGGGTTTRSLETQAAMGLAHSSESTRVWLDQWHSVLTRYSDEVWGGLSPLVAQARDEVDQLQHVEEETAARPPAGTRALDRLRQILGHLRE